MKYFQWSIGTTSVRNPDRLREGLQILKDHFKGQKWDTTQQQKFFELLLEHKVYEMDDENYAAMTDSRKQEHARKWISVLNQLGFCFAYESSDKNTTITNAGEVLLSNPEIEDEIFLRQLLKYQKPSILPKQHGEIFKDINILPFIVSLKMVYDLNGLSKDEISIFLNTTIRMQDIEKTIEEIKDYRLKRNQITGNVQKRDFYFQTQIKRLKEAFSDELGERENLIKKLLSLCQKNIKCLSAIAGKKLLSEITKGGKGSNTTRAKKTQQNIIEAIKTGKEPGEIWQVFLDYYLTLKTETLTDYADLTARYLRKSGLFSVSHQKLIINTEKEDLIKSLLTRQWTLVDDKSYLDYLWSAELPTLPSDAIDYLKEHLVNIKNKEQVLFTRVGSGSELKLFGSDVTQKDDISQLKKKTRAIETNIKYLKEIEFYRSQKDRKQVEDIINFYDLILNKELLGAYYPAYLEWNTWRAFLAINALTNKPYEARNFKIDDELQPISHAPGNRADMVFEYDNFVLVTEVTLTTGDNQHSAESEPVQRHVAKIQAEKTGKDVFGVFIAPSINPNAILTFFNNRQYSVLGKIINLTILPFSVSEVQALLSTFNDKHFSTQNLKQLLESIKSEITISKDAITWHAKIPGLIKRWQDQL